MPLVRGISLCVLHCANSTARLLPWGVGCSTQWTGAVLRGRGMAAWPKSRVRRGNDGRGGGDYSGGRGGNCLWLRRDERGCLSQSLIPPFGKYRFLTTKPSNALLAITVVNKKKTTYRRLARQREGENYKHIKISGLLCWFLRSRKEAVKLNQVILQFKTTSPKFEMGEKWKMS